MANVGIATAIARQEGYFIAGSRAQRNHNPGNIDYGQWAKDHGSIGIEHPEAHETPRFARFPTAAMGWAALLELLQTEYKGYTIEQFVRKFAPSIENNVLAYIEALCHYTGLTSETVIDGHL